jgi:transposase
MRSSYLLVIHCEKMAVADTHVVSSTCCHWISVKEGNSAGVIYEPPHRVYGDACMGASSVRRWVKHFKDGNTDIAYQPCYGRSRTAATERSKQEVDELIREDLRITVREISAQLGVGHHAVQEMMETFGYWKVCSRWVPRLLTDEQLGIAIPSTIQSGFGPLSDYYSFGPLKGHLRGHHCETDEAVQEAVRSWLRGAGTVFYRRGIFKNLQRWQKCVDRDGDFVAK